MLQATISVEVRVAWWLWPYLAIVKRYCLLTGREPNWGRVHAAVNRALRPVVVK